MIWTERRFDSPSVDPYCSVGMPAQAWLFLPAESVQTVLTSPPYWSLRDYEVEDQIGCDDSLDAYLAAIVAVFEQIRRVLRP